MKKIMSLLITLIFLLCGCGNTVFENSDDTLDFSDLSSEGSKLFDTGYSSEFRGAWLSYLEIRPKNFDVSKNDYQEYIKNYFQNFKKAKINNVFVQVRPFADAIYQSSLFPSSSCVVKNQGDKLPFDFFQVIIEEAKNFSIEVHAWINPYRIQNEFDESKLCSDSFAKKWLSEKDNCDVIKVNGGLYFNPASLKVQELIIDGVREILENYDVSGIHIDDYFYPSSESGYDKVSFDEYSEKGGKLNLAKWRSENINSLLSGIYNTVKDFSKDKIFSISPGGDIEKNKKEMFADCKKWCSESGYCDMIIPQIYYGFNNEKMPFEACAEMWIKLVCDDVKLVIGLALYKSGKTDAFAGKSGKDEWIENNDIIKRQVELSRRLNFAGFCLYSAQFVNFTDKSCSKEMQNLINVL